VLCADFKEKRNFFWRVTVSARSLDESGGWRSHPGEEFLSVISGTLALHTEHYETVRLGPGDSILFDATMRHAYVAAGEGDAVLLMSNTIPLDTSEEGGEAV
jgi:quercetin dioxygenase-like cupin family protein